jgi:hypothetical protein
VIVAIGNPGAWTWVSGARPVRLLTSGEFVACGIRGEGERGAAASTAVLEPWPSLRSAVDLPSDELLWVLRSRAKGWGWGCHEARGFAPLPSSLGRHSRAIPRRPPLPNATASRGGQPPDRRWHTGRRNLPGRARRCRHPGRSQRDDRRLQRVRLPVRIRRLTRRSRSHDRLVSHRPLNAGRTTYSAGSAVSRIRVMIWSASSSVIGTKSYIVSPRSAE